MAETLSISHHPRLANYILEQMAVCTGYDFNVRNNAPDLAFSGNAGPEAA